MTYIKEEKQGAKSVYYKITTDKAGKELSKRKVEIPLYRIDRDDGVWFLLYDDDMNILTEPTRYLNFMMSMKSITTRKNSANSLRLLYIFLSLHNCNVRDITLEKLNELIKFLQGINLNPVSHQVETYRCNESVNNYLGVYREFFRQSKIPCEALFDAKVSVQTFTFGNDSTGTTEKTQYINNLRTSSNARSIPKYISPDEFEALNKKAIEKQDKLAQCIMRLMYCYGMRLGEVLGLTIEDIKEASRDNTLVPLIIIRNRVSDKEFQYAKNLGHIQNKEAYKSKQYTKSRAEIIIDYSLYELILDYINEVHVPILENNPDKYAKGNADIVSLRDIPEFNHYVFLNRKGNVLSGQTWGNYLKQYFLECNIQIDTNVKEFNLSHRFRHGFAMLHAHYRSHPVNALELQTMMRHKALSSTMVYYNPTAEEEFKIKEEFIQELFELIPSLEEGSELFK